MSDARLKEHIEIYETFKHALVPHFTEDGELIEDSAAEALSPLCEAYASQYHPAEVDLLARAAIRDMSRAAIHLAALRDSMPMIPVGVLDAEMLMGRAL